MSKQVQIRRGSTSQHSSFTGVSGEITVDTDISTVRVHDNSLVGGHRLAKYVDLTTSNVTEGTNLYYTNARVYTAVTSNLALKANVVDLTTSNVTEGTNLYYTNARAHANIISTLQNVSNITLSANSIFTSATSLSRIVNLGNTISFSNINLTFSSYFTANAAVNTTWAFVNASSASNVAQGFILELYNGGGYTMTWPSTVRWPANTAPTLSANLYDLLMFITDNNGVSWRGSSQTGYTA